MSGNKLRICEISKLPYQVLIIKKTFIFFPLEIHIRCYSKVQEGRLGEIRMNSSTVHPNLRHAQSQWSSAPQPLKIRYW